jgi:hypothetical protein
VKSLWNLYLEAKLALDLTIEEGRLADAIARNTLGFRVEGEHLGRQLLRDESRLHGRSLDRARDGLIAKGLLRFDPGEPGRGHRSFYALVLDPEEKAAQERPIPSEEKAAEKAAQKAAQERPRSEERGEDFKTSFEGNRGKVLGPVTGEAANESAFLADVEALIREGVLIERRGKS